MTEPTDTERAVEARWLAWEGMVKDNAQVIAQVPDEHLIGDARAASRAGQQRFEYGLEMQHRLKVATEKLTAELVMFRESAEAAAERSEAAARRSDWLHCRTGSAHPGRACIDGRTRGERVMPFL